ncbi:MAG: hypothetical protein NVS3B1_30240 [Marmoricola sp.]
MKTIEERLAALEATVASMQSKAAASAPVDLTDKYANFVVRKSPPKWIDSGGADYAGKPIAETSPEFCDAIASFLDWQASKDEERNHSYVNAKGATVFPAQYARKDAARARAWAAKLRAAPQPKRATQDDFNYGANDGDGIPF